MVGREGSEIIVGIGAGICVDRNGSRGMLDISSFDGKNDGGFARPSVDGKKEGGGFCISAFGGKTSVDVFDGCSSLFGMKKVLGTHGGSIGDTGPSLKDDSSVGIGMVIGSATFPIDS